MRIAALETLHADTGRRAFDFVKVTTDDGLVGWSEYNEAFGGSGLTALIDRLAPTLVGKDPRAHEAQVALMQALRRTAAGGVVQQAVGAIENALLDVKARALGIPVFELLGGPIREEIDPETVPWQAELVTRPPRIEAGHPRSAEHRDRRRLFGEALAPSELSLEECRDAGHDRRIAENAAVSEPLRRQELGTRPGRGDRRSLPPRDLDVFTIVDHERRQGKVTREPWEVECAKGFAHPPLEPMLEAIPRPGSQAAPAGEALEVGLEVRGRRDQRDRLGQVDEAVPDPLANGPGTDDAAPGVGDDAAHRTQRAADGAKGRRHLRNRHPPTLRRAVSRSVEPRDREPTGHQRLHERAQLATTASPSMNEQDPGARPPGPRRDATSVDPHRARPRAGEEIAFPIGRGMPGRRQEQALRQPHRGRWGQPAHSADDGERHSLSKG
jgi:hypothetical protein